MMNGAGTFILAIYTQYNVQSPCLSWASHLFSPQTHTASSFQASIVQSGTDQSKQLKIEVSTKTFSHDSYTEGVNSFTQVATSCMQPPGNRDDRPAVNVRSKIQKLAARSDLSYYNNQAQWRHRELKGDFAHWHSVVVGKRQQQRYMPHTAKCSTLEEGA